MRPGGGKGKGGGFELDIGYKLSLWLSDGKRKDICCRTVGSGAQFTAAKGRGTNAGIPGDIRSQDELADKFFKHVVVECKFWKDLEFLRFLERKGELYQALEKVKQEATELNRLWWLICRQNRRYDIVLMPSERIESIWVKNEVGYHMLFAGSVFMFKLDEFTKSIKPDEYLEKEKI